MKDGTPGRFVIGVTGASGAIYAHRLLTHLKALGQQVHLVVTDMGKRVCNYEGHGECLKLADKAYANDDFFAPIASGSYPHRGMVVIPCSMGTLGKIAHGIGDTLLTRAADVCLKEKRTLIVVPRETPMSGLHLQNQKMLSDYGAVILPACPSFYHKPQTIEDLVDTVLARVLDHLGLDHEVGKRWRDP